MLRYHFVHRSFVRVLVCSRIAMAFAPNGIQPELLRKASSHTQSNRHLPKHPEPAWLLDKRFSAMKTDLHRYSGSPSFGLADKPRHSCQRQRSIPELPCGKRDHQNNKGENRIGKGGNASAREQVSPPRDLATRTSQQNKTVEDLSLRKKSQPAVVPTQP